MLLTTPVRLLHSGPLELAGRAFSVDFAVTIEFIYPLDRLLQFEKVITVNRKYTSVYLSTKTKSIGVGYKAKGAYHSLRWLEACHGFDRFSHAVKCITDMS